MRDADGDAEHEGDLHDRVGDDVGAQQSMMIYLSEGITCDELPDSRSMFYLGISTKLFPQVIPTHHSPGTYIK